MKKEFKEDNMILLEYRTKYYFISCVLDILEEKKNLFKQDEVDAQDVFSIFQQRYSNMDTHWNIPAKQLEIYLLHMRWMGLIGLNQTSESLMIRLTDAGKNAFQSQVYHSIAANLYYSKKTEILTKISIAIAILSMIIALFALLLGCSGRDSNIGFTINNALAFFSSFFRCFPLWIQ